MHRFKVLMQYRCAPVCSCRLPDGLLGGSCCCYWLLLVFVIVVVAAAVGFCFISSSIIFGNFRYNFNAPQCFDFEMTEVRHVFYFVGIHDIKYVSRGHDRKFPFLNQPMLITLFRKMKRYDGDHCDVMCLVYVFRAVFPRGIPMISF
jgi:hypothetical protein